MSAPDDPDDAAVARLVRPRPPTGLPVPAYDGRSLPNIAASVVRATDGPPDGTVELAPPLADDLDPWAGRAPEGPTVVFLVDGFGWASFDRWRRSPASAAAAPWSRLAAPITSVYPTTTTAALVSLSTGTPPARSGVVGYRQFLPRFGAVVDMLRMAPVGVPQFDALVGPEWSPSLVSGAPTIFRRGVPAVALSRDKFEGTGLTRLLYDGAEYVPYSTASDCAHLLATLLDRARPPPVIFTYWDELDTVHHRRGPVDRLFAFEAERLAHLIDYVAREVAPARARSTTLIVTADHGQVPLDPARQLRVDLQPDLAREMARPLAGDRRTGFFAAFPGREGPLEAALRRRMPEGSRILAAEAAIAAGLFGPAPHHPELQDRVGDFVVLVPEPTGLIALPPGHRPAARAEFFGGHGGLAPEELLVPLVRGPLGEFRAPGPRSAPAPGEP